MTARGASPTEKLGNWKTVFDGIAMDLTPDAWREMVKLADATHGADEMPAAYRARIELGVAISRIVAANDRAAAIAAAMLTQSGISRPVLDLEDME